jgi:hypothetical protein
MSIAKKIITCMFLGLAIFGCSKDNTIKFCEGVDNDGNGVRCGKKFTTGDITGVINFTKPFEVDNLIIKITHIEKNSKIVEKTIKLKVESDKNKANTTLPLYNGGNYKVEVFNQDNLLAEGEIEAIDTL